MAEQQYFHILPDQNEIVDYITMLLHNPSAADRLLPLARNHFHRK